jgi:hypothetical protein
MRRNNLRRKNVARKKGTLVDDVLRSCVPKKSQSFVGRLSAEDREEIFALRSQYQSGALGKSAYAVARALIAVARERGWKVPGERHMFTWLHETP